ncbi:hypothetical protein MMC14_004048 [Varicellaria rhodocarpa]|nr:hypothetical protein [Varicellaria rhodocarpa]
MSTTAVFLSCSTAQSFWSEPSSSTDDAVVSTFAAVTSGVAIPTNAVIFTNSAHFSPASSTSWNGFTTIFTPTSTYPSGTSSTPAVAPSSTTPAMGSSDCLQCSLYWQWASVYYWPTTTWSTDYSNATVSPAVPTIPAEFSNFQYPSVYIVLSTINAGNPCTKVGQTYNWVTLSYAPGELSTIVSFGGPTQAYDPANQPATPTSLQSGEAYVDIPVLAPPPGIFDIDPDWSNCVEGTNQGFDPPSVIQMGTAISPPNEAQPHPL